MAPTTRDRLGRIWAPVLINDRGPYKLVLDTGASRSALTQQVVDELGLPLRANAVKLRGVTGSAIASVARVDSLQFGELRVENTSLPIVADAFGGAQGVLGGDGLDDMRVVIEFKRDRISIMRSQRETAAPGYSVVPLLNALARQPQDPNAGSDAVIGVTAGEQKATSARIPSLVAGTLIVRNAPIVFSDLQIFDHWRLNSEPALTIGMDVLGVLDTLVIDYRRGELHVKSRS